MRNENVIEQLKLGLPEEAKISDINFEGANIVLYTKSREFFLNSKDFIRDLVDKLKKRIELRVDPSFLLEESITEGRIKNLVPPEAGLKEIWFDSKRSTVILEAEKPGLVIGKDGQIINQIREETLWLAKVRRAPMINSDLIRSIRKSIFENSEYRRNFMDKIGKRIYNTKWERTSNYWIRISFLGAAREVGRSCFLLQTPMSNILLDCGLNVAASESGIFPQFDAPEFDINKIDAVVVTHAHLDHSGAIPLLFKYGYKGPIYCTEPCRDIITLLALDFIDVMQKSGKKPLFSSREIKDAVNNVITLEYDEVTDIAPDVRLTLHNAGHVLGSALAHFNIGEGFHNMLYTGDFNFAKSKLMDSALANFQRLETLIMESTYGGKDDIQPSRQESEEFLLDVVKRTLENKGKILVPVLGVGRAQEIMLILEEAISEGKLPKETIIYVDGMVWDVTAIYTTYPEFMNKDVRKKIFGEDQNPFIAPCFKRVASQEERNQAIHSEVPCVFVATSGMLTGGASVEYFKALAENPKNAIIFVSYQAEGSLGRRIQRGEKQVIIEGNSGKQEMIDVKLDVYSIEGLSGHSDRTRLLNYIKYVNPKPKKIILIHGESSKCLDLASSIHKTFKIETIAPRVLDALRIR